MKHQFRQLDGVYICYEKDTGGGHRLITLGHIINIDYHFITVLCHNGVIDIVHENQLLSIKDLLTDVSMD